MKRQLKMHMGILLAATALTVSACGSSDSTDSASSDNMTTTTMMNNAEHMSMLTPKGAACSQIPTTGAGSVAGMANDPAATAASNNPLLSTLVTAVKQAGLVDTLNGSGPFTIFAPINPAFEKVPAADLKALLADQAKLKDVLTYHVVAGRYTLEDVKDGQMLTTVEGKTVKISGSGTSTMVNSSNIVCGDVPVGNGVVHLVDTVLMPS